MSTKPEPSPGNRMTIEWNGGMFHVAINSEDGDAAGERTYWVESMEVCGNWLLVADVFLPAVCKELDAALVKSLERMADGWTP